MLAACGHKVLMSFCGLCPERVHQLPVRLKAADCPVQDLGAMMLVAPGRHGIRILHMYFGGDATSMCCATTVVLFTLVRTP